VADALRKTDAETLIVADADVWAQGLPEALQGLCDGRSWAIPHRGVLRLSEAATDAYLKNANGRPGGGARCGGGTDEPSASYVQRTFRARDLTEPAYLGTEGGGIVLLARELYAACPLDSRFAGWGSEDDAWGMALRTLYGPPLRVTAPLIHLFHPPQQRMTRSYGSLEGRQLRKRYAGARGNPDAMRSLIKEGHDAHRTHEPPHGDRATHRR
jgi:hypothetical protein